MGSRKAINSNKNRLEWPLTPQQGAAVDLLASGHTMADVATTLDVGRSAVSDWLHHHPGFQAELNQRRQELWHDAVDRLRGLLPKALEVLAQELEGDNPLPAALHVLKSCGLYGLTPPDGSTSPLELAYDASRQTRSDEWHAEQLLDDD